MALKKRLLPILNEIKDQIQAALDSCGVQIFGSRELKQTLKSIEPVNFTLQNTSLTLDDLIHYLMEYSCLKQVDFKTPRTERLYLWRSTNCYQFLPALRPKGYYSHLSAMYLNGLIASEPENVYFNNEQHIRSSSNGALEQSRIDQAFKSKQRITTAVTPYDGKAFWLLNGKQTNNLGVATVKISDGIEVPTTDLERTLIDITVRPAYAGGIAAVLQAFRLAQNRVSISKLAKTLQSLDYVYPYYQSLGFYIDTAGNYNDQACQIFLDFQTFKYDFYLDYAIPSPSYSAKWKLYYPSMLG